MSSRIRTPESALAYIERHGVVLQRTGAVVPSLIEAIVGGVFPGSWWSHPDSHLIFGLLGAVQDSPDILRCRLVDEKISYAHRRVWPALVRLAKRIGPRRLDRLTQEHTASGAHRSVTTKFPTWVPAEILEASRALSEDEARTALEPFVV
jgi:hypothetical protein